IAAVVERDTRAGREVANGARDEDLTWGGLISNAGADDRGDPSGLPGDDFALAGMDARSDVEPKCAHALSDGHPAANGAPRRVERREESIAGRVYLDPAMAADLGPDQRVMALDELTTTTIAELSSPCRAAHDVCKKDGREEPVSLARRADTGEELLDRINDLVGLGRREPNVVATSYLDEARTGDVPGHVATLFHLDVSITARVDDERRHAHRGEDATNVVVAVHAHECGGGPRTRHASEGGGQTPAERLVVGSARHVILETHFAPPPLRLLPRGQPLFERWRPGVIIRAQTLREAPIERKRDRALGVRGREEDAHRATLRVSKERRSFRVCGVHHGAHVVHPLLKSGQVIVRDP